MQAIHASVTEIHHVTSARAAEWADLQEGFSLPLYRSILSCIPMLGRCRLLDLGCGSGAFCSEAAMVGLTTTGLDSPPAMIRIARERHCGATFVVGTINNLHFAERSFDSVTAINTVLQVASARLVLADARRLVRGGGAVVMACRAPAQYCDATGVLSALDALGLATTNKAPDRFALAADGVLERLATQAGLTPVLVEDVECPWTYQNANAAVRGLIASGAGARAAMAVGENAARRAILDAIRPFKDCAGGFVLRNRYRYVMAVEPEFTPHAA